MRIHEGQPVLHEGAPLSRAAVVMILLHSRGGSGEEMLELGRQVLAKAPDVALVAPQAVGGTWYPQRFFAPLAQNEPHLTSAVGVVAETVDELLARRIARERILLVGFSQGACVALEFVVRHPERYGGVVALSGGLAGPPGSRSDLAGSLHRTPVFLGCGDRDPQITVDHVDQTANVLRRLQADVMKRIYAGLEHTVNDEEIATVASLVARAADV